MKYKIVKLNRGYVMTRENTETQSITSLPTLKSLRANDKNKIVAVSSDIHADYLDDDINIMNKEDCDRLLGIKPRRDLRKITDQFKGAESKSIEEFKGIMLVLRQQMYDYLSGRITHKQFLTVYYEYEAFLGERGIAQVNGIVENDFEKSAYSNGWMPDNESADDEYYNDYLQADHLVRELKGQDVAYVNVQSWCDELGYVVMFRTTSDGDI